MQVMTTISIASTPLDKPVTQGSYRILRHPIYFGSFLILVGMGIAGASWVVLLCALLWIAIFCIVVPGEERFILKEYRQAYGEYMNRTPRWIGIPRSAEKP